MHKRKPVSALWIVLMDVLLTGVALLIFAYFHHVRPQELGGAMKSTVSFDTPAPVLDGGPSNQEPLPSPESGEQAAASAGTPEPVYGTGDFTATFPMDDPEEGEDVVNAYQDDNLRVTVKKEQSDNLTYYVADVWVRDIRYFQTAFATGKFQRGSANYLMPAKIGADTGAVVGITGDFCSARSNGVVIRNGELYRDSKSEEDVCILYADGTMETYYANDFQLEDVLARGAYQSWCFGPKLIDDGQVPSSFNCSDAVAGKNPRSAIGYYAPGHYCLLTVDGRQPGYSKGLSMEGLSKLLIDLGCKDGYNLDGGQTAAMVFEGSLVSQPYKGGREVGDMILISTSPLS